MEWEMKVFRGQNFPIEDGIVQDDRAQEGLFRFNVLGEVPKDLHWPANGGYGHTAPLCFLDASQASTSGGSHRYRFPTRKNLGTLAGRPLLSFLISFLSQSWEQPSRPAVSFNPQGLIAHPLPSGGGQVALGKPEVTMEEKVGLIVHSDTNRRQDRQRLQTFVRTRLFGHAGTIFPAGCGDAVEGRTSRELFRRR